MPAETAAPLAEVIKSVTFVEAPGPTIADAIAASREALATVDPVDDVADPAAPATPAPETPTTDAPATPETPETPAPDAPTPDGVTLAVPGSDEAVVLTLEDPDARAAVDALLVQAQEAETLRSQYAAVEQQAQELEFAERLIRTDPVGFVLERMPALAKAEILRALATDPAVVKAVGARFFDDVQNPEVGKRIAVEVKAARVELREALEADEQARQASRQSVREVFTAIQTLAPKSTNAQGFIDDAVVAVKAYAERLKLDTVRVDDLPVILAQTCRAHGLTPVQAAELLTPPTPAAKPPKPVIGAATRAAPPPAKAPEPRPTTPPAKGAALVAAAAAKRSAATPAAGRAPAPVALPSGKGKTLQDAFKDFRSRLTR